MEDIHTIFSLFIEEFPEINAKQETLGKEVHEKGGPLDGKNETHIKTRHSRAYFKILRFYAAGHLEDSPCGSSIRQIFSY